MSRRIKRRAGTSQVVAAGVAKPSGRARGAATGSWWASKGWLRAPRCPWQLQHLLIASPSRSIWVSVRRGRGSSGVLVKVTWLQPVALGSPGADKWGRGPRSQASPHKGSILWCARPLACGAHNGVDSSPSFQLRWEQKWNKGFNVSLGLCGPGALSVTLRSPMGRKSSVRGRGRRFPAGLPRSRALPMPG